MTASSVCCSSSRSEKPEAGSPACSKKSQSFFSFFPSPKIRPIFRERACPASPAGTHGLQAQPSSISHRSIPAAAAASFSGCGAVFSSRTFGCCASVSSSNTADRSSTGGVPVRPACRTTHRISSRIEQPSRTSKPSLAFFLRRGLSFCGTWSSKANDPRTVFSFLPRLAITASPADTYF